MLGVNALSLLVCSQQCLCQSIPIPWVRVTRGFNVLRAYRESHEGYAEPDQHAGCSYHMPIWACERILPFSFPFCAPAEQLEEVPEHELHAHAPSVEARGNPTVTLSSSSASSSAPVVPNPCQRAATCSTLMWVRGQAESKSRNMLAHQWERTSLSFLLLLLLFLLSLLLGLLLLPTASLQASKTSSYL